MHLFKFLIATVATLHCRYEHMALWSCCMVLEYNSASVLLLLFVVACVLSVLLISFWILAAFYALLRCIFSFFVFAFCFCFLFSSFVLFPRFLFLFAKSESCADAKAASNMIVAEMQRAHCYCGNNCILMRHNTCLVFVEQVLYNLFQLGTPTVTIHEMRFNLIYAIVLNIE